MITPNDITIKRLKDAQVKGSFSIICDDNEQFRMIQAFFETSKDFIKFKSIPDIGKVKEARLAQPIYSPYFPLFIVGDTRLKFLIKYESLNELLKLREVFNIRANKFDMYLIKKRGYDMFTPNFYQLCADMTIYKVKK